MATSDRERLFDDWALAWSSIDSFQDPERVLSLFVDDCFFEDVPFGLVVSGKEELRSFVKRANAKTNEVNSSHAAYISHPKETAKLIEEAATSAPQK